MTHSWLQVAAKSWLPGFQARHLHPVLSKQEVVLITPLSLSLTGHTMVTRPLLSPYPELRLLMTNTHPALSTAPTHSNCSLNVDCYNWYRCSYFEVLEYSGSQHIRSSKIKQDGRV